MLAGAPGQSWLGAGGWHASCSVPLLLVSEHSLVPPSAGPGAGELEGVASGARGPPRQVSVSPLALPPADRTVPAELGKESQAFSCVQGRNSACLSSSSRDDAHIHIYILSSIYPYMDM